MTTRDSSASREISLYGVRQNNLKGFDLTLPACRLTVITGLSGSGKSSLAFDTLFAEGQRRYIETFSPYARQFFDRMDKPQVDRIEGIPPAIAIEQRNTVRSTRSTVGTMTEIADHVKVLWPHLAGLNCPHCGQRVVRDTPQRIWEDVHRASNRPGAGGSSPCVLVTFQLPLSEKLAWEDVLQLVRKQGYQRLLAAGAEGASSMAVPDEGIRARVLRIEEALEQGEGSIADGGTLTVVQDRIRLRADQRARFVEACEQAYHFGKGRLTVHPEVDREGSSVTLGPPWRFSRDYHCARCDAHFREPSPALFSFNHPLGACPTCRGFGRIITIDYQKVLPDPALSLADGAIKPWRTGQSAECWHDLMRFCRRRKIPTDVSFKDLKPKWQQWVLHGDSEYGRDAEHEWPEAWYGVDGYFRWLESKSYKMHVRVLLSRYRSYQPCPACHGSRFQPESLQYTVRLPDVRRRSGPNRQASEAGAEYNLAELYALPVRDAATLIRRLASETEAASSEAIRLVWKEIQSRLDYLVEVGLGYLTLDRPTRSLSGGETERVNLTACLGSRLVNTLFVLDEPSVGLHPRDTGRLVNVLGRLRDLGNTVVVVEHEAGVIESADQVVDLGPEQGERGGEVVFQGTFDELLRSSRSLTGQYLSGRRQVPIPARRPVRRGRGRPPRSASARDRGRVAALTVAHARLHNLKDVTVRFPLQRFVCVTGVSGSGKTSLMHGVLQPLLRDRLASKSEGGAAASEETEEGDEAEAGGGEAAPDAREATLTGWEGVDQAIMVDQSSLGRTPRSNPAVYIGAFDAIRGLFASTEAAKQRGLPAGAFSFNSVQGQCERCRGAGFEKIEMQFLSDVFVECPECRGRRYREHILEVTVAGAIERESAPGSKQGSSEEVLWNIADLLAATVDEAVAFLESQQGSKPAQKALPSLRWLQAVGLGYLRVGQPINTLSGGECQRLKLVRHLVELNRRPGSPSPSTLFLFDEPTTGLHFDDIRKLLHVFQQLVDAGHSLIVIEHNLDVIRCADWVIDLGPEAGDEGGWVVAEGAPEEVASNQESRTGEALRSVGLGAESFAKRA